MAQQNDQSKYNKNDEHNGDKIKPGDGLESLEPMILMSASAGAEIAGTDADEVLDGTAGDDIINGGGGYNIIDGMGGDDQLIGGGDDDDLIGGAGNDHLDGGEGLDWAIFSGTKDQYSFTTLNDGSIQVDGPDGTDIVSNVEVFSFDDGQYNAWELGGSSPSSDSGSGSDDGTSNDDPADGGSGTGGVIEGTNGDDRIDGTEGDDVIRGNAGYNVIDGQGGDDQLIGGDDDDDLRGGTGNDNIDGGDGYDWALFSGTRAQYSVAQVGPNTFEITGPDGTDVVSNVEIFSFDDGQYNVWDLIDAPSGNNDPNAVDDNYTTQTDQVVEGNVLDNDSDPDGDALTAGLVDEPLNGSVVLNSDGTFVYTPNPGTTANYDRFSYCIYDGNGGSSIAYVNISLTTPPPANTPPEAGKDYFNTDENVRVDGNVLVNDVDADGDSLTARLVSNPSNGSVTLGEDGQFWYTPKDGWSGTDRFWYEVSDGNGGTDTACVTITVKETSDGGSSGGKSSGDKSSGGKSSGGKSSGGKSSGGKSSGGKSSGGKSSGGKSDGGKSDGGKSSGGKSSGGKSDGGGGWWGGGSD